MKADSLTLEAGGVLAPPLGAAHGLRRSEVRALLRPLRNVMPTLLGAEAPSGFLRVVERPAVLRGIVDTARTLRRRSFEDLIHIGIGGSALGAQTVLAALGHPLHNLLPRAKRKGPRVHFVDNVDPASLAAPASRGPKARRLFRGCARFVRPGRVSWQLRRSARPAPECRRDGCAAAAP
jgi:hypothetical protein